MMNDDRYLKDTELDALFEAAASDPQQPSDGLLARVVADAEMVADARETAAARPANRQRPGWLQAILGTLGGWPAVAGLATATIAGVWIGYASPDTVTGISDGYLSTDTMFDLGDFLPTFDTLLDEG